MGHWLGVRIVTEICISPCSYPLPLQKWTSFMDDPQLLKSRFHVFISKKKGQQFINVYML